MAASNRSRLAAYDTICHELEAYSAGAGPTGPRLVVINKIDQDDGRLHAALRRSRPHFARAKHPASSFVSAAAGIKAPAELAEQLRAETLARRSDEATTCRSAP